MPAARFVVVTTLLIFVTKDTLYIADASHKLKLKYRIFCLSDPI